MYNPALKTFITAVDCGSFTRAAEQLYISSTAVMKQMNALENHLELKLIVRTPSGIHLTPAGEEIYRDAKYMMEYSSKALARARMAQENYDTTFCVGTSLLNPAKPFMDLWYQVSRYFPDYKLHVVPFDDDHTGILGEIRKLGKKFDFLVGVCDSHDYLETADFLPIGRYRKMIAVPRQHPLAEKEKLSLEDLHGETLMMVPEGDSGVNDFIRHDLQRNHPEIVIEDTQPHYDLEVFNKAASENKLLLNIECWKDVHPGLVSLTVDWDYSIPYGIMYAKNSPSDVVHFIDEARLVLEEEEA